MKQGRIDLQGHKNLKGHKNSQGRLTQDYSAVYTTWSPKLNSPTNPYVQEQLTQRTLNTGSTYPSTLLL